MRFQALSGHLGFKINQTYDTANSDINKNKHVR